MKISTKGRYGIAAVLELALNGWQQPVSVGRIAEKQGLPVKYLEHLFTLLRKAGIVGSERGAQGGYVLSVSPENLTADMVLDALEGTMAPVRCVAEGNIKTQCEMYASCASRYVWKKIKNGIYDVASSVNFSHLAKKYKLSIDESYMYYI